MSKVKLTIGDWSQDGHNEFEMFVYEVNKPVEEIRQAYKDSCKKTGLQFNHNENYTGLVEHSNYKYTETRICTEYEDDKIREEAIEILKSFDFDLSKYCNGDFGFDDVEQFCELILDFIKLSLPDLTWKEASFKKSDLKTIEPINGWWNESLNVQFGYGLFDC